MVRDEKDSGALQSGVAAANPSPLPHMLQMPSVMVIIFPQKLFWGASWVLPVLKTTNSWPQPVHASTCFHYVGRMENAVGLK